MSCGHELSWYDMFPIFSFIFLRGKCRYCGAKLSKQYPLIEALNGILWCLVLEQYGISMMGILTAALLSMLIVLSVIDERTREIPPGINIFILVLGIARVVSEFVAVAEDCHNSYSFFYETILDEYSPFDDFFSQTITIRQIIISHALGLVVVAGVLLLILLDSLFLNHRIFEIQGFDRATETIGPLMSDTDKKLTDITFVLHLP